VSTFPDRYREVSVVDVDVPLEVEPLRELLMSRPVYRRTRYLVVRRGPQAALVEVTRESTTPLFTAVTDVTLLAAPDQTAYVHRPEVDTGVASALAAVAAELPDARCVVVEGRYGHVSFVLDATPVRLRVLDVAPPWPAKLVDQVERVLDTAEDLPAIVTVPEIVSLESLIEGRSDQNYLLQCRGGGMDVPGASVSYLDEVPPRAAWTLLGCARSRAIHDAFYDGPVEQVDTCPRNLAASREVPAGEVLLTKCCLLETHIERDGRVVVVPWGASFGELREGLAVAAGVAQETAEPDPLGEPA
jgi:hypothetical protein